MKYFVTSDIHGFFDLFIKALQEKGFEESNPNHKLIICGDIFDRGDQASKIYHYLKSLGNQFIFIKGNHEDLFEDCLKELNEGKIPSEHHFHNGTVDTIDKQLLKDFYKDEFTVKLAKTKDILNENKWTDLSCLKEFYKPINEVLNWIKEKSINYFETKNYIFVHGWIPEKINPSKEQDYLWNGWENEGGIYNEDWRNACEQYWKDARWLNGMHQWKKGIIEPNKTIVCGHWHCSFGNSQYHLGKHLQPFPNKNKPNWEESFVPFKDKGIIALDACTAYSQIVNIEIIEDLEN